MSTKKLKACLSYLRDIDFDRECLAGALAELEAIEKAARHVMASMEHPFAVTFDEWRRTIELMRVIAAQEESK